MQKGVKRYISDLHFGHENVIPFDNRPWATAEEMDRAMIEIWNETVLPEDDIWILGDFCFRSSHPAEWYLKQLKGKKHLIAGNHDRALLRDNKALAYFESIDKSTEIQDGGKRLILCHYPILEWNGYFRGSYHLFGHIHNRRGKTYEAVCQEARMLNCAAALTGYRPVTFEELKTVNQHYKKM